MKLIGWFSRLLGTALLVSCISMLTTWSMVNMYVDQLLGKFPIDNAQAEIRFSDFLSTMGEQIESFVPAVSNGGLAEDVEKTLGEAPETKPDGSEGADSGLESDADPDPETMPDAVPVWQQQGSGYGGAGSDAVIFSAEALNEAKNSISEDDKMYIFTLLMSKVPAEELQVLSALLEGGVTADEMDEMEAMLLTRLEPEEYEQLLEMLGQVQP